MTEPSSVVTDRERAWTSALGAWDAGNLPLAFHYCQAALAAGMTSADLHALMASIALGLGQYAKAGHYANLADAARLPPPPRRRYLVIHPWGCGFWGEVDHVLAQLAVAELTSRRPIVFWGAGSLYRAPGYRNAWDAYFEPVSEATMDEVTRSDLTFAPARWNSANVESPSASSQGSAPRTSSLVLLDAPEDVAVADCHNRLLDILPWAPEGHWLHGMSGEKAYRSLAKKYLRVSQPLAEEIGDLASQIRARAPVLAVHYRTQSPIKVHESTEGAGLSIVDYLPHVDRFLAENAAGAVFLLTDYAPAARAFLERYPNRILMLPAIRLEREEQVEVTFLPVEDRSGLAKEVIRDVYLAAECDLFLGDGASGVSCAIGHLKEWAPGSYNLLRGNVTLLPGRIQTF